MLSPSKRGAVVEYEAVVMFINAGFEVFLNASADGPADFMVWSRDTNRTYPVDTKKLGTYTKVDGTVVVHKVKNMQEDVTYLGYTPSGWMWMTEPPAELADVI